MNGTVSEVIYRKRNLKPTGDTWRDGRYDWSEVLRNDVGETEGMRVILVNGDWGPLWCRGLLQKQRARGGHLAKHGDGQKRYEKQDLIVGLF